MRVGFRCIFPEVYKIPADCQNKSIFKSCLAEPPQKLLREVAESKVTYLSPFDSAAILNRLLENTYNKGISELRRDPFYRPVASKLVDSIQQYRQELLFYFIVKIFKLHDTYAIQSLVHSFVKRGVIQSQNLNQLIELLYYLSHHIPKELRSDDFVRDRFQGSQECSREDNVQIYCEFIQQTQLEIINKILELRDRTLIYKLVTALDRLPSTENTVNIVRILQRKVKVELEQNNWNCKHLTKIVKALASLEAIDNDLLRAIIRSLELNQDNLDSVDIKEILEVLEKFDLESSPLYISLQDKLEINKQISGEAIKTFEAHKYNSDWNKMETKRTTIIPTEAIISLSKTHPLFQSDKVTLSAEAAELIAHTVEFRIKQVIQVAQRFMVKSCRYVDKQPALLPSDVRDALRTLRMESHEGYTNCYDYRYVTSSKLYKGNRVVKCESTLKNAMDERCWGRQKLTDIVARDMQKAIPAPPGLTVHWMLVSGTVPALATNMALCTTEEFNQEARRQMLQLSLDNVNFLNSDDAGRQLEDVEKLADKVKLPMSLGSQRGNGTLEKSIVDSLHRHLGNSIEGTVDRNAEDKASSVLPKITIPKVEHILTKEQRFFLKEIKNTVKRASISMDHQIQVQLGKVLSILRNSPALDQLLPELSEFFVSELERTNGDLESILKFAEALSANEKIQIHFHVHQLVGPLLSIMLRHDEEQDLQVLHHNLCLRKLAAKTLGNIANNLRNTKKGLEGIDQYLMTLYKRAIVDERCSITVLYGAICGIAQLPLGAKRIIFFPLVPLVMSALYKKHCQAHGKYATTGSKVEEFKFVTCQEIVHMATVILYDTCFEDVLECVQDSGIFSISHEAQVMIHETLNGGVEKAVNPENFLPIYMAFISKCYETLRQPKPICEEVKAAAEEVVVKRTKRRLPEIDTAQYYSKLQHEIKAKRRHSNHVAKSKVEVRKYGGGEDAVEMMELPWYIGQATHSMTLTI